MARRNPTRKARRQTNIPNNAIVNVQQDPYSSRFLTDGKTAKEILKEVGPTHLGGKRTRRKTRRHRR
jgi:hypothetical protein